MTALTIQDVSRRSGLSEPTLRYYEQVGLRHAGRIETQIATLRVHLDYLRAKAALWDARDHGDPDAEAEASLRVQGMYPRLEEVVLR
jgi:hypothetical protein